MTCTRPYSQLTLLLNMTEGESTHAAQKTKERKDRQERT